VPPKPLHPVFHILLLTAIAVGIVALFGLEFKYHLFVDLMVVAWILTLNFSEIITFTFLNIIVGLLSVLVAIGFEVLWFLFYRRVCSSELVVLRLRRRRLPPRLPTVHLLDLHRGHRRQVGPVPDPPPGPLPHRTEARLR
jgi:hypothetical protein